MLRPHYLDRSGQVTYTVINPGGAYFGADAYLLDVAVDRDASLALTTQSATKVYRTPQGPASQEMTVRLGPGAVLEYVPDQLIVYRGGSYIQRTRVDMDPAASLLLAEVVTPGWSPSGESFAYDELRMRTEVWVLPPGAPASSAAPEGAPAPPEAQVGKGVDPAVPAAGARQGLPNGVETTSAGLGVVDPEDPELSPGLMRPMSFSAPSSSRPGSSRGDVRASLPVAGSPR